MAENREVAFNLTQCMNASQPYLKHRFYAASGCYLCRLAILVYSNSRILESVSIDHSSGCAGIKCKLDYHFALRTA